MDKPFDTKNRILERTLIMIGQKGTVNVTVREIAAAAEVNVSAVNYHFQTKAEMFSALERYFLTEFTGILDILTNSDISELERVRQWSVSVMDYLAEYPGVLILFSNKLKNPGTDAFGLELTGLFDRNKTLLRDLTSSILSVKDSKKVSLVTTLLVSALVHPVSINPDFYIESEMFKSSDCRRDYIDMLISSVFRCNKTNNL